MFKKLAKKIQQWLCTHDVVRLKSGAHHKAGWEHDHKVTCSHCNKVWKMKGREIYFTYGKEKECYCKWGKS